MNPQSMEDLLESLRARGLFLGNLFQLPGGLWQANVNDGKQVWGFAKARSPCEALRGAMFEAASEAGEPWKEAKAMKPEDLGL